MMPMTLGPSPTSAWAEGGTPDDADDAGAITNEDGASPEGSSDEAEQSDPEPADPPEPETPELDTSEPAPEPEPAPSPAPRNDADEGNDEGEDSAPLAAGPDGGNPPYVYWDVKDADTGTPIPGATFKFDYRGILRWNTGTNASSVGDCVGVCSTSSDGDVLDRDTDG